ncbi:hypothetical protein [Nonomuraea rubra]|uniref:hypothetical protein n=1 Tax=Nonomuraea rubra TaxID=46180 RepID=UPI0031E8167E
MVSAVTKSAADSGVARIAWSSQRRPVAANLASSRKVERVHGLDQIGVVEGHRRAHLPGGQLGDRAGATATTPQAAGGALVRLPRRPARRAGHGHLHRTGVRGSERLTRPPGLKSAGA